MADRASGGYNKIQSLCWVGINCEDMIIEGKCKQSRSSAQVNFSQLQVTPVKILFLFKTPSVRRNQEELVTNFVSERPSSWYAKLYKNDELLGGHVIMLGPDPDNR